MMLPGIFALDYGAMTLIDLNTGKSIYFHYGDRLFVKKIEDGFIFCIADGKSCKFKKTDVVEVAFTRKIL